MKLLTLWLPLCLIGCAELQKDYEARTCHYDGAYQAGSNDAQSGKAMNAEALVYQCPESSQADVRRGYREGYTTSKKETASEILAHAISGARSKTPSCQPKAEAHRNFCTRLDKTSCSTHSGVCTWE